MKITTATIEKMNPSELMAFISTHTPKRWAGMLSSGGTVISNKLYDYAKGRSMDCPKCITLRNLNGAMRSSGGASHSVAACEFAEICDICGYNYTVENSPKSSTCYISVKRGNASYTVRFSDHQLGFDMPYINATYMDNGSDIVNSKLELV